MNYYTVLGILETATKKEIKMAFLKLSKKHHPDVGGDTEIFKNINEAYQTLKDTEKRAYYDKHGQNKPKSPTPEDMLIQIFSSAITSKDFSGVNIVKYVSKFLTDSLVKFDSSVSRGKSIKLDLEKYKKRISSKKPDNILNMIIDGKIKEVENRIQSARKDKIVHEKMIEIMSDYDDSLVEVPQYRYNTGSVFATCNLGNVI